MLHYPTFYMQKFVQVIDTARTVRMGVGYNTHSQYATGLQAVLDCVRHRFFGFELRLSVTQH